jgi:DNA-binding CsgD family transcriptional regulator
MQYIHGHIPLAHYLRTRAESALKISDFSSQRQFHDTGLYSDFYGKYDVEDDLCLGISSGTANIATIAWHSDRHFTDGERRLADLARPHIVQAWQNARIFSRMHDQLNLLEQGLDGAALGMIACEAQGRVLFITALARQYLAEYFGGPKHVDRVLPPELLGWVRDQNAQLKTGILPPARSAIVARKNNNRLIVRMLSSDGTNLLLLEQSVSSMSIAATDGHALSRREREVLALAAQGKTNGEIAAVLGMSPQTAKKHMEHILHKMGVENRTAAVALSLQSLSRDK